MAWSADQVLALAPDGRSAKAGRGQATPARWSGLGASDRAVWGLCQGSGATPYETAVDLTEPAFRCSCPSRKVPCKHALGLMLLHAQEPGATPPADPPPWAAEWLAGRDARSPSGAAPAAEAAREATADDGDAARARAAERRAEQRERRIADGLDELELWLEDVVRQGLAHAERQSWAHFDQAASRLVDAQAPGLARRVRQLGAVIGGGAGWPDRALAQAGTIALLAAAYRRQDALDPALRAEVRSQVGWNTSSEQVLAGERVEDEWDVAGAAHDEDDRLHVRRTWLWGRRDERWALLLDFGAGSRPLPPAPAPGHRVVAELAFYPAAAPLRAVVAEPPAVAGATDALPALESVSAAYEHRARMLAANPFADRIPLALRATVVEDGARFVLRDDEGAAVAVHPAYAAGGYELLALSGGRPIDVFGEWLDGGLRPLSAAADGELWPL
jgi:SWIM zinc finger